jgi:hypothetical protein
MTLPDRLAQRAASVRFTRALLTVVVLPLFVLGWLAGAAFVGASWLWAAAAEGFATSRSALGRDPVESVD